MTESTQRSDECSDCGELLEPDTLSGPRMPCPNCGSMARKISLQMYDHIHLSARDVRYENELLQEAHELLTMNKFGAAIVVAHSACEVAVDLRIREEWDHRGLADLQGEVPRRFNGHNLGNEQVRTIFNALTETRVEDQPFWSGFERSSRLRNKIVHQGKQATKEDAQTAIEAADGLIAYVIPSSPRATA